jgi:hypothetical protein
VRAYLLVRGTDARRGAWPARARAELSRSSLARTWFARATSVARRQPSTASCTALTAAAPAGLSSFAPSGARRRLDAERRGAFPRQWSSLLLFVFLFFYFLFLYSPTPSLFLIYLLFFFLPFLPLPTTSFPGLVLDLEHLTLGVRGQEPNQGPRLGGAGTAAGLRIPSQIGAPVRYDCVPTLKPLGVGDSAPLAFAR